MKDRVDDVKFLLLVGEELGLKPTEALNTSLVQERLSKLELDKQNEIAECFGAKYKGVNEHGVNIWRKSAHDVPPYAIASYVSSHMKRVLYII